MGLFDFMRRGGGTQSRRTDRPQIADSQKDKDKSIAAAGSIYFVKWTSKDCTMSDTCTFYNEHERDIFVNDCKLQGYYISTWHESRDAQVADTIEQIKAELMQVLQDETDRLKYNYNKRVLSLESDNDLLQSKVALLTERLEHAQANTSTQDNSKRQEQAKQVKTWARKIIASLDCSKVQSLAQELEQEQDFAQTKGNMQGRLIAYYAHKIINT